MATISDIVRLARDQLSDTSENPYWSDQELARHCLDAVRDMWRAMEGLNEHYQQKIESGFILPASTNRLILNTARSVYKIKLVEPTNPNILLPFHKVRYNSLDHYAARGYNSIDLGQITDIETPGSSDEFQTPQGRVYYSIDGRDNPSNPPSLRFAPTIEQAIDLTVTYIPTLESLLSSAATRGSGRDTIFNGTVNPTSPTPQTFFEVDITVPSSSDGQLAFGFPDNAGYTLSPIFEWRLVSDIADPAAAGDSATTANGVSFPISHEGAGLRSGIEGEADYSGKLIDVGNVTLGRNIDGKLLIALDSQLAIDTLLPIEPLRIYRVQRLLGGRSSIVDTDATIPLVGEPDRALMSYVMAFALAKQRDQRTPEPVWLQVYATEKQSVINSLADPGEDTSIASDSNAYPNGSDINVFVGGNFSIDQG